MESFLKLIMLVKDKFLKKNKLIFFFKIILLVFLTKLSFANTIDKKDILINYMQNIKNFSANFIQSDGQSVEEGIVYIGENRIRVDYLNPSKISIVMDQDKAMYVNYDLKEVQYFDPQDSAAGVFINIFKNNVFLDGSNIDIKNKSMLLKKEGEIDNDKFTLLILFEKNPDILRKIKLEYNNIYNSVMLSNHNFNAIFDKKFFTMVNPFIIN